MGSDHITMKMWCMFLKDFVYSHCSSKKVELNFAVVTLYGPVVEGAAKHNILTGLLKDSPEIRAPLLQVCGLRLETALKNGDLVSVISK